ncbi:MAG: threonine ammonia-lyase [Pseudomonadales bacterium]|nr:threonine ammonia-lyase [Pseudomonadales bacterium]MCP5183225.1 threonine ammonia-lyase [Pseudomonadales bacterium]
MDIQTIQAAHERLRGQIIHTPCQQSFTLSKLLGCELFIKFENQQFTASFKERGALNALLQLDAGQRGSGVIAMSAGNHAQAVAYHGARLGIPVTIVMPRTTPNAKVEQTRVHGAEVILFGNQFEEARAHTLALAEQRRLTLLHPFDDEQVMAGQGTVGLEIVDQVRHPDVVVVPVGGGGLISGVATAVKALSPATRVVGVQMQRFDTAVKLFCGESPGHSRLATVAEGIAVKQPGERTMPIIRRNVDAMVTVSEEAVEQAIFVLLEIEKTVAEGAGAAALAAVQSDRTSYAGKRVVVVLSGGNIDMMILSSVLQRGMVRTHRLVRLRVEIPDVPGALADMARVIGSLDSNIIEIHHQRAFGGSSVRATVVELVLQMRGEEQISQVLAGLVAAGYEAVVC